MSFRTGERVDLADVANATGIHRTTLSKINNIRGYNMTSSNVDRLCKFFNCTVGDLMVYVPDEEVSGVINKSFMGPTANSAAAAAGAAARHANKS
jgi:putative transcriptional regulator